MQFQTRKLVPPLNPEESSLIRVLTVKPVTAGRLYIDFGSDNVDETAVDYNNRWIVKITQTVGTNAKERLQEMYRIHFARPQTTFPPMLMVNDQAVWASPIFVISLDAHPWEQKVYIAQIGGMERPITLTTTVEAPNFG